MIKMEYRDNKIDYNNYLDYLKSENLIDEDDSLDYWSNYPIDVDSLKVLYRIYKKGYKFLDLGCGCGQVLRFSNNIGYDVEGIDFNKKYDIYNKDYKYTNKDIRKIKSFKKWDIIYLYRPSKDKDLDILINKVIDGSNIGTLIVTPYYDIIDDRVEKVELYLYRKK